MRGREEARWGPVSGSIFLDRLGVSLPVLAAPMAGGPTTPALVLAAAGAGSLGFLAAGYQQPETFADQVAGVAAETDAYGVNLFAPHPVPVDPRAYAAYREALRPLAERLGVDLPEHPVEDDDHWHDKVDVLVAAAPPVVSFTFGLPDPGVGRGAPPGRQPARADGDHRRRGAAGGRGRPRRRSSCRQPSAGGHSGTFTPERPLVDRSLPDLVAEIGAATSLPVVAGGGVVRPEHVAAALAAGAAAVAVGHGPAARPGGRHVTGQPAALTRDLARRHQR